MIFEEKKKMKIREIAEKRLKVGNQMTSIIVNESTSAALLWIFETRKTCTQVAKRTFNLTRTI